MRQQRQKGGAVMDADARRTVLVIDDSEVVLELVKDALEGAGVNVVTRQGPQGSVAAILKAKPDLVLLDVNMPTLTGDAIAKIVSKAEARCDTRIVLHSSLSVQTLRLKALSTGADGFIQKTDDMAHLVREVTAWLQGRSRPSGTTRASSPMPVTANTPIPMAPIQASPSVRSARVGRTPSGPVQTTVLFVDEDPMALSFYRRAVTVDGMVAEYAVSFQQALRQTQSAAPPDIVVSDILDAERGIELYEGLRQADPSWRFRFILVAEPRRQGIDRLDVPVLRKPVDPERLCDAIRYAMTSVRFLRVSTRLAGS
jgi:two-component system OmpR family response regulator